LRQQQSNPFNILDLHKTGQQNSAPQTVIAIDIQQDQEILQILETAALSRLMKPKEYQQAACCHRQAQGKAQPKRQSVEVNVVVIEHAAARMSSVERCLYGQNIPPASQTSALPK
jgi:hypothetical protein